jgi:hypothetical protein
MARLTFLVKLILMLLPVVRAGDTSEQGPASDLSFLHFLTAGRTPVDLATLPSIVNLDS